MMELTVNEDLLTDEGTGTAAKLPAGVFKEEDWDPGRYPGRVELFRANGRVYTLSRVADPRMAFRYLRDLRKSKDQEMAMANLLGEVLGDAIMDVLAEEELTPEQIQAVMKAVSKHTMGALNNVLGG